MLTLKEMTSHLRKRIKVAEIDARVRMSPGGGAIQVFVPKYGMQFSDEQQRSIRFIAQCNKLTWVRGLPIDVEQMTNPDHFEFYLQAA